MDDGRRKFLKIAGGAVALAAGAKAATSALAQTRPQATGHGRAATAASPGTRKLAMVIDLRQCSNEIAEIAARACHEAHNVPDWPNNGHPEDDVKWIWSAPFHGSFPEQYHDYAADGVNHEHAIVMCNHCENPPCVRVCPTEATFKNPDNGIVMMDYHRCIGCRFCVSACPYGARSLNFRDPRLALRNPAPNPDFPTRTRGVVEKCNFCAERLAAGGEPACVEAVRRAGSTALMFGDLNRPDSEVRRVLRRRYAIRRKPSLGTKPVVYYLV